jgi:hypothetical protein
MKAIRERFVPVSFLYQKPYIFGPGGFGTEGSHNDSFSYFINSKKIRAYILALIFHEHVITSFSFT